jgi:ArsR family transcriptional regulator
MGPAPTLVRALFLLGLSMQDDLQADQCARRLRAVADPDRLRIIQCLRDGPKNVGEIAAALGAEIVNVSHHLGVLRNANMVQDSKQGRFVLYQLHPDLFQPGVATPDHLNLGCCRIEIPRSKPS